MPNPNNPIFFPELNGTDGSTCGVYSFGFTSGCTDDNDINRGFTQEWYYDGSIGAWVSVTVGVTGGGADFTNAGATYTAQRKNAPKMTGSGLVKKYAYLDPETGALTFDYINTFEIVNPEETQYTVNDFEWTGAINHDHSQEAMNPLNGIVQSFTPGVTLCAPIGYTFEYNQSSGNQTQFKFYINRRRSATSGNTLPSPFAPVPNLVTGVTIGDEEYLLTSTDADEKFTVVNINGDSTVNIPMFVGSTAYEQYYSGESGEVIIKYSAVNVGFTTAGGPLISSFQPKLLVDLDQSGGSDGQETAVPMLGTNVVRHENWIYTFIAADGTGISGDNFRDYLDYNGVASASGERRMIDPRVRPPGGGGAVDNYVNSGTMSNCRYISYTFTPSDYGGAGINIPNVYAYFAIPTRVGVDARRDLQVNGENQGWDNSLRTTISITNEFGYNEPYHLFRTVQPNGIPETGVGIHLENF